MDKEPKTKIILALHDAEIVLPDNMKTQIITNKSSIKFRNGLLNIEIYIATITDIISNTENKPLLTRLSGNFFICAASKYTIVPSDRQTNALTISLGHARSVFTPLCPKAM